MTKTFAAEQLVRIIHGLESLNEQIDGLQADKSDYYREAKGLGLDAKAIREIIKLRRRDSAEIQEAQAIIDLYLRGIAEVERTAPPTSKAA